MPPRSSRALAFCRRPHAGTLARTRADASPTSRSRTSSANIPTSSITCCARTPMRRRPARCIRRSTAATTGTRASTCTGCSSTCAASIPRCPQRAAGDALLLRHLAPASIAAECAYLARPDAQAFERPYGWAWLLKLAHELALSRRSGRAQRCAGILRRSRARSTSVISRTCPRPATRAARRALEFARSASHSRWTTRAAQAATSLSALRRKGPRMVRRGSRRAGRARAVGRGFPVAGAIEADLVRRIMPRPAFAQWLDRMAAGARGGRARERCSRRSK